MPRMIAVSARVEGARRVGVAAAPAVALESAAGALGAGAEVVETRGASLAAALERSELSTLQAMSSTNRERLRISRGCIGRGETSWEPKRNTCRTVPCVGPRPRYIGPQCDFPGR